jgi:sec-independent protein translocase protein TatA
MLSGLENPVHLLILAFIVLLVFGPKRLPELGRSMGSGIRHFRDSIAGRTETEQEVEAANGGPDDPAPTPRPGA